MSIKEFITDGTGVLLVLLTLIQVTPLKLNPWSWLVKTFGNALNGDLIRKVDQLGNDVQSLRNEFEEHEATVCRTRILHFGDEILHNVQHSKEHFDHIMADIKTYENYCDSHPKFENNVAVETIKRIEDVYRECLKANTFLQ